MIYKKTFGMPEKFVPTAYAPAPKAKVLEMPAFQLAAKSMVPQKEIDNGKVSA